ncbi:MAG TPA: hypothetical protein DCW29_06525, partial [Janthinobacterium sp.]|nr:hypothetical protein [Janthinobacterium sp.]
MLALAACAAAAAATGEAAPVPAPVIHTVEEADATLASVEKQRASVEANFADSERDCYTKFFVNHCLDKAKEIRRAALAALRPVEGEANHFKRADSVDKRDQVLAEHEQGKQADEGGRVAAAPKTVPPEPAARQGVKSTAERTAEHDAKEQKRVAQEAAETAKRAANVDAFEAKQRAALERQRSVAAKLAAKEEKTRQDAAAA